MGKFLLFFLVSWVSISSSHAHEIVHEKITIYHPYLIIDKNSKAHAFLSIENLSGESEYLIRITSKFSKTFEIVKIDATGNIFPINLNRGLEIPPGGALYFESETIGLTFSGLNDELSWFDPHIATFVFKNAGKIELDFEVEQ